MSLIHWWPLNGDTQDKIGNIKLTGTFTSNTSGKIGSCAQQSSAKLTASTTSLTNLKSFSIAMWVKFSSTASTAWCDLFGFMMKKGTTTDSMRAEVTANGGSNFLVFCNSISGSADGYANFILSKDIWTHLVFIKDSGTVSTYKNGVLSATNTLANFVDAYATGEFHIGDSNFYAAYNDVRIYDHVLSQAEVKELSKALVVHYAFDDILIEPTTNIDPCKDSVAMQNFTGNSFGAITRTYGSFYGFDCVEMHLNTTYSSSVWLYMNSNPITQGAKVGDTVTRSCWMYVPSGQTKPPHFTESIEGNSSSKTFVQYDFNKCDTWQKISMTGTITDTGTNNYLHYFMAGSGTINFKWYMRDFQMEIKDHSTPYTPTSRESMLYNETGLIQPNHKANLQLTHGAGSGTYSLKCAGSTAINTPVTGDISQGATAAFWIKTPTYPSGNEIVFADYNSRLAFGFYSSTKAIVSCGGQSSAVVSNLKTSWQSGWNHVVITRNNSTFSCYLNGTKLTQSGSNNWSSTAGYSTIGCRYNGSYTNNSNCLISDFRLYYSLLSEDEIKDLCKTKAYVTNKGDIEAHEFIEKTENIITEAEFAIPAKSTAGNGKIEMRNGMMAYGLQASTYYYAGDAESSNAIFKGKFKANTQYYFDLFMDVDTMWYSGGSKYVPGGFVLRYTDGTTTEIVATSTNGTNGWKRVQFYSNPDKTVYGLGVYYYIGTKWYLRHDSGIYEMDKDNAQVTSKYTMETTQITETSYQTNALIHSSGNIVGRTIIEI